MDDGLLGFVLGVMLTGLMWLAICDGVEGRKVRKGYLTYENKTYKVVLFDKLDKPQKPENAE